MPQGGNRCHHIPQKPLQHVVVNETWGLVKLKHELALKPKTKEHKNLKQILTNEIKLIIDK